MYSAVVARRPSHVTLNVASSVNIVRDELVRLLSGLSGTTLVAVKNQTSRLQTNVQSLFNLRFRSTVDATVYDIILRHAVAAEKLGPGGFESCITKVIGGLYAYGQGNLPPRSSDAFSAILSAGGTVGKRTDVQWILDSYASGMSDQVKQLLLRSLDLAGFAGRIVVEKSRSEVSSVELVKGYTFDNPPSWPTTLRMENPRVLSIDGYVESVSEVHHLLEASSEAKEPMLVFMRGMHDDVRNTLKVNFDRGSLSIIPVMVPLELTGLNTLKDVVVVSGGAMVSHLQGHLISSIRYSELPTVSSANVYTDKVVIVNKSTSRSVMTHVRELRRRRAEPELSEDAGALLDLRIRSLSPNHVVIRLPDDKDFIIKSQSIDYVLRALRSLVDHGTIVLDGEKHLMTTAVASTLHAQKCLNELASLGCIISP